MGKGDRSPLSSWKPVPLHPPPHLPMLPELEEGRALTRVLAPNPPAASGEVRTRGGPPPSQHSVPLHLTCAVNVISGRASALLIYS